jgi:hypothetical protein
MGVLHCGTGRIVSWCFGGDPDVLLRLGVCVVVTAVLGSTASGTAGGLSSSNAAVS